MEAKFQISAVRKEFKNGGNGWQVFVEGMEGNLQCKMNFREPLKAMRYMFALAKQLNVQVDKVSLAALSIEYQTAKAQTSSQEGADNTSESESSDEDSDSSVKYDEATRSHDKFLVFNYEDIKKKHPDALLLFRCGDMYECYEDDAEVASNILGITLTERFRTGMKMVSFPHHALDVNPPRLIRAGQRVAICDQLENPRLTKKLVKRGITEIAEQREQRQACLGFAES